MGERGTKQQETNRMFLYCAKNGCETARAMFICCFWKNDVWLLQFFFLGEIEAQTKRFECC
jgi:hypothetical protein